MNKTQMSNIQATLDSTFGLNVHNGAEFKSELVPKIKISLYASHAAFVRFCTFIGVH